MQIKILAGVILVLFLSGCATTKKGQDIEVQQLKSRVSSFEAELQTKEQEIDRLESELEKTREKRLSLREEKKEAREISTGQIQLALKRAGFYKGAVDGKIGPATNEAIKAFQRANGLKADGIVGRKTRARMMEYLAN